MIAAFGAPDEPEPNVLGEPRNVDTVHLTLLRPDGTGKAGRQAKDCRRPATGGPDRLAPAKTIS